MRKMKDYIVRGKKIFIGLEDSKLSWKISCRSEKTEVHYASMPAEYSGLRNYLRRSYPECQVTIILKARCFLPEAVAAHALGAFFFLSAFRLP